MRSGLKGYTRIEKITKIEVYEDKIFLKSKWFKTGKNINIIK